MCQRKPGPRCSAHAREALERAARGVERAKAAAAQAPPADAVEARGRVFVALRELREARAAYDSTPAGRKELIAALRQARVSSLEAMALRDRLAVGDLLRETRQAQAQQMPPPPTGEPTIIRSMYASLAEAREAVVEVALRESLRFTRSEGTWKEARVQAEQRAFALDVSLRVARSELAQTAGLEHLTEPEKAAAARLRTGFGTHPDGMRTLARLSHMRAAAADQVTDPEVAEAAIREQTDKARRNAGVGDESQRPAPSPAWSPRTPQQWDAIADEMGLGDYEPFRPDQAQAYVEEELER